MSDKTTRWILLGSISAILLGAAAGYVLPEFMLSIDFVGSLFFNALKLIIVPLIVTSLVMGIVSLGDVRKVGRTTLSTLIYFLGTTSIAVVIGLALVLVFKPGEGVSSAGAVLPSVLSDLITNMHAFDPSSFITSLIPSSIPQAVIGSNYLGIIVVSIIFSFVLVGMGAKGKQIVQLFESFHEIVFKLVRLLLIAAPIGVFVLVAGIVAQNHDSLGQLAAGISGFAAVLMAGFMIHGLIVLPLILKRFAGHSPIKTFTAMLPALATAAGTASSSAALGITCHCVIDKAKVDRRAGSFVLPLGAIINLDATAMYAVVATIFVAQVFGISLSVGQLLWITITAIIGSIGIAGLPFGAIFLSFILFGVADFPTYAYAGIGLVFALDWLFDRLRAALNIWGDAIGAAVVAGTFEFKTVRSSRNLRTDRRSSTRPGSPGSRRTERSPRRTTGSNSKPDRPSRSPRDRRDGRTERTDSPRRAAGRTVRPRAETPDRPSRRTVRSHDVRRESSAERREQESVSPFDMGSSAEGAFNIESPAPIEKPTPKRPHMPSPPDLPKFDKPRSPRKRSAATSTRMEEREKATPVNDGPSKEAVDRELSKVAAQLANLDNRNPSEATTKPGSVNKENHSDGQATIDFLAAENGTVTPTAIDNQSGEKRHDPEHSSAENSPGPKQSRSVVKPQDSEPEDTGSDLVGSSDPESSPPVTDSEPEPPARQFGRTRTGRTSSTGESKETDSQKEEVLTSTDAEYKSENQSFGRAKKKRVR